MLVNIELDVEKVVRFHFKLPSQNDFMIEENNKHS
jgi:hypothetical protein